MLMNCSHQYFKIGKLRKNTESENKINSKIIADYFKEREKMTKKELLYYIGPFTLEPSLRGVRVVCALCNKQKDLYEYET